MRIFKTKGLVRFARRQRITDRSLVEAIERADRGLIDADLGDRAVFLYGFAKNERDNIDPDELLTMREIGAAWLAAEPGRIDQALAEEILQEVTDGNEEAT